MLTSRVIPCLDVRNGRVVKGVQFQGLRDAGCPVECAARYASEGADELVMLDVSATLEERGATEETIRAIRNVLDIPLTVGGGIQSVEDAQRVLNAGADKVAVNSAAVVNPSVVGALKDAFGRQCTVVAVDAVARGTDSWEVVTRSGTQATALDVIEWLAEVDTLGAGEILLTSWDRDGTRDGYDLPLLKAASERTQIPIIASGGADSAAHMADAFSAGASAVLAASIFHDGDTTVRAVKESLAQKGIKVRLC